MILSSPIPKDDYKIEDKTTIKTLDKIYLSKPKNINVDFLDVLKERKSNRTFSSALTLEELSPVLWYTFKTRDINCVDKIPVWEKRYIPTAGGLGTIRAILFNVIDTEDSLYLYSGMDHSLNKLDTNPILIKKLRNQVDTVLPSSIKGTVILLIADVKQINIKYENPESLIWKDTGVINHNLYLISEAYSLKTCSLGYTFKDEFSEFSLNKNIFCVGSQIIGY